MLGRRRTLTSMSASMGNDRATAASASTEDDSLVVGAPLSLNVSSPALLLNHMAERYVSTSRILMEFVDNSLDDAENFFDHETGAYGRAVDIRVYVSRNDRTLRIVDNCNGMAPDQLSRVVMRVGESRKRGASFVNGQFGFGMQAFRAACTTLTVKTRASSAPTTYQIRVRRDQSDGFALEAVDDEFRDAAAVAAANEAADEAANEAANEAAAAAARFVTRRRTNAPPMSDRFERLAIACSHASTSPADE